jgi:hypothetical protein
MKVDNKIFICSIYKLTNTANQQFYIGSTRETLAQRIALHRSSVKHNNTSALYRSMKDTGCEKWGISLLEKHMCTKPQDQFQAEETVVQRYRGDPNCLNERYAYVPPEQKKAHAKQRLANVITNKKYYCRFCDTACINSYALNKHNTTTKHIKRFIAY